MFSSYFFLAYSFFGDLPNLFLVFLMSAAQDLSLFAGMLQAIWWVIASIFGAVVDIYTALANPSLWLDWSDKQALIRFIYFGASTELFFVFFVIFALLVGAGLARPNFLWLIVRSGEGISNSVGRFFAWAGLIMVIQQIIIVFMQRIFARPDIVIGFGIPVDFEVSWYSEELKLYNAAVVCLCLAYTFVQRGHVRVDLFYAPASFRVKKIIDMCGALFFMFPMAVLMWVYTWFFMWRHLITPKISASDKLELVLRKARIVKWNVETIGFSPNGFTGYFLFKVLMVLMVAFVFIQMVALFSRSLAELREGPSSKDKYLDVD